ncbi:chemotaxis protein CheB, partial [Acidisphaera rubrifaciens]|uniref:chemotaxis protein CheB n=1 Tax=Acidisphaera rubrifaciens TaxID=50715 RepID=UPI000661FF48
WGAAPAPRIAPGHNPPERMPPGTTTPAAGGTGAMPLRPLPLRPLPLRRPLLLAIGSSTGGPQALFTLALGLGRDLAVPIVLTQHMPPAFTAILAEHITRVGGPPCAEARDGELLRPGAIHLAPGDRHLLIHHEAGAFRARLSLDAPENYCRPAVDPMLRTATRAADGRILVVMLTGMGHDGLDGTRSVIDGGGAALAQDEATSVVWGMPGAIARAGLCHAVLPLDQLAPHIRQILRGGVA